MDGGGNSGGRLRKSNHCCLIALKFAGIDDDLRDLPEENRVAAPQVDQRLRRIFGTDDVEIGRRNHESQICQEHIVATRFGEDGDDIVVGRQPCIQPLSLVEDGIR